MPVLLHCGLLGYGNYGLLNQRLETSPNSIVSAGTSVLVLLVVSYSGLIRSVRH